MFLSLLHLNLEMRVKWEVVINRKNLTFDQSRCQKCYTHLPLFTNLIIWLHFNRHYLDTLKRTLGLYKNHDVKYEKTVWINSKHLKCKVCQNPQHRKCYKDLGSDANGHLHDGHVKNVHSIMSFFTCRDRSLRSSNISSNNI